MLLLCPLLYGGRVDLLFSKYSLCTHSLLPHTVFRKENGSLLDEVELGPVACFGQWNINRKDTDRSFKCAYRVWLDFGVLLLSTIKRATGLRLERKQ